MLYQLSYTPNPGSPVKAVPHRNQEEDVFRVENAPRKDIRAPPMQKGRSP